MGKVGPKHKLLVNEAVGILFEDMGQGILLQPFHEAPCVKFLSGVLGSCLFLSEEFPHLCN